MGRLRLPAFAARSAWAILLSASLCGCHVVSTDAPPPGRTSIGSAGTDAASAARMADAPVRQYPRKTTDYTLAGPSDTPSKSSRPNAPARSGAATDLTTAGAATAGLTTASSMELNPHERVVRTALEPVPESKLKTRRASGNSDDDSRAGIIPVAAEGDPGPTLSVDEAINACLMADPVLKAGFEDILQAKGDWVQSSLKPNPTLAVYQSLLPLGRQFTPQETGGPPQLDVGLALPIDWCLFGKRVAAMASAAKAIRVSEHEYADLVRNRVRDTAVAFFNAAEAKGLRELAQENLDNLTRVESVTAKAVDDGGRPRVELNRIRLDVLAGRQALRESETAVISSRAALRALMGRTADSPPFEVPSQLPDPRVVEPLGLDASFEVAMQERPDLQALRMRISKARSDMLVEYRNGMPLVTPRVGYTRQFQQQALGMPDADSWGAGFDVTLPVHNRNQGNRLKSFSVARQSGLQLQAGQIELRSELESVSQELRASVKNSTSIASEQIRLAAEVRDSITQAYEAGGRPLIDLLDAQRNYRETYRLYITARADFWRAWHRYNAAVGRQVFKNDNAPLGPPPPPNP